MSKYAENFIEVLREHLPIEDHPDKQYYTWDQVIREYEPHMMPVDEFDNYRDGQCICGHDIKYIYRIYYKRDKAISIEPIGSECINKFYTNKDNIYHLKRMLDSTDIVILWNGLYTTNHFKAKNGFSKDSLLYLKIYDCLTNQQYETLKDIVNARKNRYLKEWEIRKLYGAMKNIQRVYNSHIAEDK